MKTVDNLLSKIKKICLFFRLPREYITNVSDFAGDCISATVAWVKVAYKKNIFKNLPPIVTFFLKQIEKHTLLVSNKDVENDFFFNYIDNNA